MSNLSTEHRTLLEDALNMQTGYVLDFTNTSFAHFFDQIGIDIFDEKYAKYGTSKANRLRALWHIGSDAEVSSTLSTVADHIEAKRATDSLCGVSDQQLASIRKVAAELSINSYAPAVSAHFAITTAATVVNDKISIEIQADIYRHIKSYLESGHYYNAVEESYKLVREKLRELTGNEKASDVFNPNAQSRAHYQSLFGRKDPANSAEADFFRGVGYLHLGVQHLRNEKAHTPAGDLEPNLATHYIALASLAYDLITRYVSDEVIEQIENLIRDKRRSYRSAGSFYRDFKDGRWLQDLPQPASLRSKAVRKALKDKWLQEADFTQSYDQSNIVLMQLELVADELTRDDLDDVLRMPTHDRYGNDQQAGIEGFLSYIEQRYPDRLSPYATAYLADLRDS